MVIPALNVASQQRAGMKVRTCAVRHQNRRRPVADWDRRLSQHRIRS
ncbi:hypothetical protein [Azospirillum endophyticum]